LSLRKLKVHLDMSEETTAFSAELYADGVKVAFVRNNGTGGCHEYHWYDHGVGREMEIAVHEWARKQPLEFDFEHLDQIVSHMIAKKYHTQKPKPAICGRRRINLRK
jgi:hypothetical protein